MQKGSLGYMIMLYSILGSLLFCLYVEIYYDVKNYFLIEMIIIAYGILLPITIPSYIKSLRKYHKSKEKDDNKFSPIGDLLSVMFAPLLLISCLSGPIIYLYSYFMGENIQYPATVYEHYKGVNTRKNWRNYNVYVKSEYFDEILVCKDLYYNTQKNSEILIKKRISALGSVVKYKDIAILKY